MLLAEQNMLTLVQHLMLPLLFGYMYMTELLKKIVTLRLEDRIGMAQKMVLEPDDPKRISAVLASVPPPPTHAIVAEQRSRLGTVESLQTANSSNNVADDFECNN
jgi:hypothetical protein